METSTLSADISSIILCKYYRRQRQIGLQRSNPVLSYLLGKVPLNSYQFIAYPSKCYHRKFDKNLSVITKSNVFP